MVPPPLRLTSPWTKGRKAPATMPPWDQAPLPARRMARDRPRIPAPAPALRRYVIDPAPCSLHCLLPCSLAKSPPQCPEIHLSAPVEVVEEFRGRARVMIVAVVRGRAGMGAGEVPPGTGYTGPETV